MCVFQVRGSDLQLRTGSAPTSHVDERKWNFNTPTLCHKTSSSWATHDPNQGPPPPTKKDTASEAEGLSSSPKLSTTWRHVSLTCVQNPSSQPEADPAQDRRRCAQFVPGQGVTGPDWDQRVFGAVGIGSCLHRHSSPAHHIQGAPPGFAGVAILASQTPRRIEAASLIKLRAALRQ